MPKRIIIGSMAFVYAFFIAWLGDFGFARGPDLSLLMVIATVAGVITATYPFSD